MTSSNFANNNSLEEAVAFSLGMGVEVIELAQLSIDEERDRLHLADFSRHLLGEVISWVTISANICSFIEIYVEIDQDS